MTPEEVNEVLLEIANSLPEGEELQIEPVTAEVEEISEIPIEELVDELEEQYGIEFNI